jgi:hypothetical protein
MPELPLFSEESTAEYHCWLQPPAACVECQDVCPVVTYYVVSYADIQRTYKPQPH